jgi:hypothetical protein
MATWKERRRVAETPRMRMMEPALPDIPSERGLDFIIAFKMRIYFV